MTCGNAERKFIDLKFNNPAYADRRLYEFYLFTGFY